MYVNGRGVIVHYSYRGPQALRLTHLHTTSNRLDALNGYLILDRDMYNKLYGLKPHFGVMDLRKPLAMSPNVGLPAPVITNIAHWLHPNL